MFIHVYIRTYRPERGVPNEVSSRIEIARDGSGISGSQAKRRKIKVLSRLG